MHTPWFSAKASSMKFSVLLPTRNRLDLLARAIETVRRQDYDDWEIVVSDNFSEEDVAGYIHSLKDQRIKYFGTAEFVPVTDNWNNALNHSLGDYIIMLGDDDGLMKGYFSTLNKLVLEHGKPDFVCTSAFLYAYPGVIPGLEAGSLRSYGCRKIFQSSKRPFLLEKEVARSFVEDSLNFRATFDYNMQFFLVSRKLVNEMANYGPFYQSPYPDYYAANAIMLKARKILVVPTPLVTIGISPKSFGFYYFNDAEGNGNEFLNNLPDQEMVVRLKKVILPGITMNTSWLIAMETLSVNLGLEYGIKVNYARYRLVQIFAVFAAMLAGKNAGKAYQHLKPRINIGEWLRFALILELIWRFLPRRLRERYSNRIQVASGSHPASLMPETNGEFQTILDVFEQVDPENQSQSAADAK